MTKNEKIENLNVLIDTSKDLIELLKVGSKLKVKENIESVNIAIEDSEKTIKNIAGNL